MKTDDRKKHLENIEPLSDSEVIKETYLMVIDMKDNVVTQAEFKLLQKIFFGVCSAACIVLVKIGLK